MPEPVLQVRDLSIDFQTARGLLRALRNVDLTVPAGEIVGVVGESGCGKSTLIFAVLNLLAGNARVSGGEIQLEGRSMLTLREKQLRKLRGDRVSIVFQDPMTSLNPVLTVGTQMTDIQYRANISTAEKRQRATAMLGRVGLVDAEKQLERYPHQFSGGMRQRIAIAMALLAQPALLIADEPTTALDATLEMQIIELLQQLQEEIDCSILFVSHHLGLVAEFCRHVVVMYAGEVVEEGPVRRVFRRAGHPYTRALLECDPARITEKTRTLPTIPGEIPDLVNVPSGCIFKNRCRYALAPCQDIRPPRREVAEGHFGSCHLLEGHDSDT
jgi:oligopeptide/dipeptide ABC transporter ATP-binding protein